jgi:hypothetical protein
LAKVANQPAKTAVTTADEIEAAGIKAFPNPVSGKLTITGLKNGQTIALYDLNGNKVRSQKVNRHSEELDMQQLIAGAYQLLVTDKENRITNIRIIKQ